MPHPVFQPPSTALITGAASGIGLALAHFCHARGMNLVLLDTNAPALQEASATLSQAPTPSSPTHSPKITTHTIDVSSLSAWETLPPKILSSHPDGINLLVLNAGTAINPTTKDPWMDGAYFAQTIAINTLGYTNGLATMLPLLDKTTRNGATTKNAIILTGSKQGITNPPTNDSAYNASKAAIKSLAEHLSFDLRDTMPNTSVHLLIPGWTYTGFHTGLFKGKPDGAWTAAQVVEFMDVKMAAGQFYILCPDNEVCEEVDRGRILWGAGDLVQGRPALSRWREEWRDRARKEIEGLEV